MLFPRQKINELTDIQTGNTRGDTDAYGSGTTRGDSDYDKSSSTRGGGDTYRSGEGREDNDTYGSGNKSSYSGGSGDYGSGNTGSSEYSSGNQSGRGGDYSSGTTGDSGYGGTTSGYGDDDSSGTKKGMLKSATIPFVNDADGKSLSESTGEKIKDKVTSLFSKDKSDDKEQSGGYGNENTSGGYDRRDY